MTSRINTITIDAADPRVLANFWSKLLDYRVTYDSSDQVIIEAHDEAGPAVLFIETPDTKRGKNRVHLDLNPDDQQAEVERALGLGARAVDIGQDAGPDATWKVLADPEGNEFCILTPRKD
ncbi:MAG: VOC family protein [Actinobacteria bacterium]|nr:VOC family protein [Actinomycetota bacterium]